MFLHTQNALRYLGLMIPDTVRHSCAVWLESTGFITKSEYRICISVVCTGNIYCSEKKNKQTKQTCWKKERYADVVSVSRTILPSSQSPQTVVLLSLPTKHYIGSIVSVS